MSEMTGGNALYDWLGGEEGLEAHRDAVDETILSTLGLEPK